MTGEDNTYHLTLVRHGESTGNAENRLQGQSDYPLSEKGRAQARAAQLTDMMVTIAAKAGAEGKLFGSVGTQDIADAISAAGAVQVIDPVRFAQLQPGD